MSNPGEGVGIPVKVTIEGADAAAAGIEKITTGVESATGA